MTKWIIIFLTSLTFAQTREIDELNRLYNKITSGETVKISSVAVKARFTVYLALLLMLPTEAQVIITTDGSYGSVLDRVPPSVPRGLQLVTISDDSLLGYWTNPPEADFNRNVVWFFGSVRDSTSNDSIYFGGLAPNTTYGFRVLSVDDSLNRSAYSDSVQATTLDTVTMPGVPAAPTNLTVTDSLDDLTLQFTANGINTTYFDVQRDDLDYDTITYLGETVLVSWSETDTTDGVYHEYKVKARNATGSSVYCDSVIAERYTSNTYYVSSGGNSSDPTNPNGAWSTLADVNTAWLEGKNVYFKKGETFSGSLLINNNNVLLASYGSGLKPIITGMDSVSGAMNGSNWTDEGSDVWSISLTSSYLIERFWINGTEVYMTESVGDIDGTYMTYHDNSTGRFYLYSTSNPASNYTSIQYPGDDYYAMQIKGDYVTIDSLDIRGGKYASIGLAGSDNLMIRNSNIGYGASKSAIMCNGYNIYSSDGSTNNVTLLKDTIDSNRDYPYTWYRSGIGWGVYAGENTDGWLIDSCVISNWAMNIDLDGNQDAPSENHTVRNNEIFNNSTWTLGKGIQVFQSTTDGTGLTQSNLIYNNYIHNLGGAGIALASSGNKVYYNVIDSIFEGTNAHVVNNGGFGIEGGRDDNFAGTDNYVFNNTIVYTDREAISYNNDNPSVSNNLFAMNQMDRADLFAALWISDVSSYYYNNCFYRTGFTSSDYVLVISSSGKTVAEFNAYANADGNFYSTESSLANLITLATFYLPSGSDALYTVPGTGGVSISSIIGTSTTDRWGNAVTEATPNIGAYQGAGVP